MMIVKTSDFNSIKPFVEKLNLPQSNSHKGQNGRLLVIGGSSLFHSASIWAAEIASHFVDIVHYSSTVENNEIFLSLKKKFRNGIVVAQKDLNDYIKEDDAILIGPGMMREGKEGEYTYNLTKSLIVNFPNKRFVFDGGALQMMEPDWLLNLKIKPILTPHQKEFSRLFGADIEKLAIDEKAKIVQELAKKYTCVILLKAITDIISDGEKTFFVEGGDAGLTKGGTGDLLAGMTAAFYTKNNPMESAIISSYILKKSGEKLFEKKKYWYNVDDLIDSVPITLANLLV